MKISLTSDYKVEGIKQLSEYISKKCNAHRVGLREILEKEQKELRVIRQGEEAVLEETRRIKIKEELEKVEQSRGKLGALEISLKNVFGESAVLKEDYIYNLFYLEIGYNQEDYGVDLDCSDLNKDIDIKYEININFSTKKICFYIEPEQIEISADDLLENEKDTLETKPDKQDIKGISKNIGSMEDLVESEEETKAFESELSDFEKAVEGVVKKSAGKILKIEKLLETHKEIVLKVDYLLKNFAREHGFWYETDHTFSPKEDKNQRKFEFAYSQ